MENRQGHPPPRKSSMKTSRVLRQRSVGSVTTNETGGNVGDRKQSIPSLRSYRKNIRRQQSQPQEETTIVPDHLENTSMYKHKIRKKTGVVYDERMEEHCCLWDSRYPECPQRVNSIVNRCEELDLLKRCERVPARRATKEEILQIHSLTHMGLLLATSHITDETHLEEISQNFDSIYLSPSTFECASLAAGSSLELVDAVVTERLQNGFAIVRPPGHHATQNEFCGFCYINNVALAARRALDHHGLSKILIVDWDVHHGQGTQQAFYTDPRVLYFSIHRFENGEFWPNLRESDYDCVGKEAGQFYNFNVPLNQTSMSNSDYLAIFHQVLLPVAYEFQPELILVSAGFDAALGCPEGKMTVSPGFYSHLTSCLMTLANGKVVVLLEGGYCLESLSESAAWTLRALLGDPCSPLLNSISEPSASVRESILNIIYVQRAHWTCFGYQGLLSQQQEGGMVKRGEVVSQSKKDAEATRMIEMKEARAINWPKHTPSKHFKEAEDKESYPFKTRTVLPEQSEETVSRIQKELEQLKGKECCEDTGNKLCLVYDSSMTKHHCIKNDKPERETPERILKVWEHLEEFGVLKRAKHLKSRTATRQEVMLVHTAAYVDTLSAFKELSDEELLKKQNDYKCIYLHRTTNDCALLAAGCMLQVVDEVCKGYTTAGVGVVRPPGHHAESDKPYGFCFYNNIAVAAKYALQKFNLQRVLILDWDVHHGNGIQHIFYEDRRVLYISLHRYDNARFFPSLKEANYNYVGKGVGKGFNINIPWNQKMGDTEYIAAMVQVILPVAYQFDPELVFISAGFDAARGDPTSGGNVSPECYGHMTRLMSSLAKGRLILGLEGGYSPATTSCCLTMCAKSLLGDPLPTLKIKTPNESAVQSITNVIETHKNFWSALCFQVNFSNDIPVGCRYVAKGNESDSSPSSSGSPPSSSSYPPPESSPSSRTSTPFVSAPSSPEKTQDAGSSQTSPGSPQGVCGDKMEFMRVDMTPQRSVRHCISEGSSGESTTGMTAQVTNTPTSTSQTEHCEFSPASGTKKKPRRRSGRENMRYASTERGLAKLKTASASKILLHGKTAVITTTDPCKVRGNMDVNDGISAVVEQCQELGLWQKCIFLPHYHATEAEIMAVYTQHEVTPAKQCTLHSHYTFSATGSVVSLVREVMSGSVQNGMALLQSERYPVCDQCVAPVSQLSEIAVAVHTAFGEHELKRVLIVEWLGEGDFSVQNIFDNDPRVLIFTIHFNTGWDEGREEQTGRKSHNINIGLKGINFQYEDFYSVFFQVLLPVAYEFSPDLVVISASHQLFLHSIHLHSLLHWQQTRLLGSFAKGHLAVVLKLGQDNEAVAEDVAAILCALLDDPLNVTLASSSSLPSPSIQATIVDVLSEKQTIWNSLNYHAQMNVVASQQPMAWSDTSRDLTAPCTINRLPLKERKVVCGNSRVCLVWGQGMEEHWNQEDSTHVERPQRLSSIVHRLRDFELDTRCHRIEGISAASQEELSRVHSAKHLRLMQSLRSRKPAELSTLEDNYDSIYFHRRTDHAATLAAGSTLTAVGSVLKGESRSGVAVIRPPGHHAEKDKPCGFCFYNNVAVAALHAIQVYGLQRVLILDWDVHHGNGTQNTFDDDPRVLYVSIHRYDHGSFFPCSLIANYDHVGVGKGQGYNINIPWNKRGMGDGDYMAAMLEVVMPVSLMFNPELVLVSAGFDAAVNDPLGGCQVTPECYGHMTRLLTCLAGGKVVVVLEGGYDLDSLGYCVALCTKALLRDPLPPLQPHLSPCQSAVESLTNVVSVHSKFWPVLNLNIKEPGSVDLNLQTSGKNQGTEAACTTLHIAADDEVAALAAGLESVVLSSVSEPDNLNCSQREETGVCGVVRECPEEKAGACGEAAGGSSDILLMELAKAEKLYAVVPATWCPHLQQVQPLPPTGLTTSAACQECQDHSENWVCLTCHKVLCGRYVNEHMLFHWFTEQHSMVLSYSDLSAWCYQCDQYVDNPVLHEAKEAAHRDKFGVAMPM